MAFYLEDKLQLLFLIILSKFTNPLIRDESILFTPYNVLSVPNEKFDDSHNEYKNIKGDYKLNIKKHPEILEDIIINQADLYSSLYSNKLFNLLSNI